MSSLLDKCIGELQRQQKSKNWSYRTHNTGLLSPDENKFDYKNCPRRKRFSEILKSEICTKWAKLRERWNIEQMRSQCKSYEKIVRQY